MGSGRPKSGAEKGDVGRRRNRGVQPLLLVSSNDLLGRGVYDLISGLKYFLNLITFVTYVFSTFAFSPYPLRPRRPFLSSSPTFSLSVVSVYGRYGLVSGAVDPH